MIKATSSLLPISSLPSLSLSNMTNTSKKYLFPKILSVSIPLYLFFLLHYLAVPITGNLPTFFHTLQDNIALDCGSSGITTALDGRVWIGDVNTEISPFEPQSNTSVILVISKGLKQPSNITNPYITAIFSYSEFTYIFSLCAGQKFVRLHFYPSNYSYPNFDWSKAFFSVKAGPYTLLNNFSAALIADAHHVDTIIKEFCVNVDEENQSLNITFTPNQDISDAFAFINGIEIVSMPTNLYYSPAGDDGILPLDQGTFIRIENSTALEMVYRVNIGGSFINPGDDTGMFRSWVKDDEYLTEPGSSVLPVNTSIVLRYKAKPNYSAPADVYTTARTMGLNKTINENYNLTWCFPVDSVFTYLVRLHFCEFQPEITKPGNRVFEIFIANLTAETQADIITWTDDQGNGIPTYQDYLVMIGRKEGHEKQNLSIALHTAPEWMTNFSDAILNAIEIIKLSQSDGNLAGPNPDPVLLSPTMVAPPSQESTKPNDDRTKIIAIVVGVVSGFVVLSVIGFLNFRRKIRVKDSGSSDGASRWGPFSSRTKSPVSHLPSDLSRHYSLAEIKAATNNFQEDLIIGVGGFGNVYKGFMDEGSKIVAVKRLNPESSQGAREFRTEIEMLSQLRHVHLVSLIGYCNDKKEMIVVYDFMINGTLRDHLYDTKNDPLPWKQRLEICKGAAIGLHYLHTGLEHTIIHRDVKTTNILLNEKWTAKVSDFGLSKMDRNTSMVNTLVKGTFGYLDPDYARGLPLTEKSDVYSFGVVLFEVLCARKAVDRKLEEDQMNLAYWARKCINNGSIYHIIDPYLMGKIAPECFKVFLEIAESCVREQGIKRPTMFNVMEKLIFALELQEHADAENDRIYPDGEYLYPVTSFHIVQCDKFEGGIDMDSSVCSMSTTIDTNTVEMSLFNHASGSATVLGETSNSKGQ